MSINEEEKLLKLLYPEADETMLSNIAAIVTATRSEIKTEMPRISTSISTRASVEFASLTYDGFTLEEAAEVIIYPQYDNTGGVDSERTFVKQIVQKFCDDGSSDDLFNEEEMAEAEGDAS